jgi:hypothetical protein
MWGNGRRTSRINYARTGITIDRMIDIIRKEKRVEWAANAGTVVLLLGLDYKRLTNKKLICKLFNQNCLLALEKPVSFEA